MARDKETGKFKKGASGNPAGRPKGAQDKINRSVREVFSTVFHKLQDDPKASLEQFAKDSPDKFYPIAAKLIPTEVQGSLDVVVRIGYGDEDRDD